MVAQRHALRLQVTGRDEEPLIAVDAELDLEARLAFHSRRIRVQERRAVLVDPEVILAVFFLQRQWTNARRAVWVEHQLQRPDRLGLAPFAQLEDGDAEVRLPIMR